MNNNTTLLETIFLALLASSCGSAMAAAPDDFLVYPSLSSTTVVLQDSICGEQLRTKMPINARFERDYVVDGKVRIPAGSTLSGWAGSEIYLTGRKQGFSLSFNTLTLPNGLTTGVVVFPALKGGCLHVSRDGKDILLKAVITHIASDAFPTRNAGQNAVKILPKQHVLPNFHPGDMINVESWDDIRLQAPPKN
jgi:hypothetical protein